GARRPGPAAAGLPSMLRCTAPDPGRATVRRRCGMNKRMLLLAAAGLGLFALAAGAADWPQWRGPHGDAKVADFTAPATWPKELTKKWSVKVGIGVATPALVGDKLYVFSHEEA